MKLLNIIHRTLLDFKYGKIFEYVATSFALAYHIAFLITFMLLGVTPMFYYNIFSVILFTCLLLFGCGKKSFILPFLFFYVEVVAHQILADYFIGAQFLFHFLILMIGFLPFFTFNEKFGLSCFFGLLSAIIFMVLEVIAPDIPGIYPMPEKSLKIIKWVNVGCSTMIIMSCMSAFSYIIWTIRHNLEEEIRIKTERILLIQNHIINSLASLVDNRDTDTGKHIQRTCAYVNVITKKAIEDGLYPETIDGKFAEAIRQAAPLHDVGKIIVPDSILKKPGRFTPQEYDIMKKHASEGGRIIDEVVSVSDDKYFLEIAKDIATHHHEKWDGTGYPSGLATQDIPVSARIMAVADVFDALVSKRCYKESMPLDEAFDMIIAESGSHFDPAIVAILVEKKPEIIEILNTYSMD